MAKRNKRRTAEYQARRRNTFGLDEPFAGTPLEGEIGDPPAEPILNPPPPLVGPPAPTPGPLVDDQSLVDPQGQEQQQTGQGLDPNMTFEQFQQLPDVQRLQDAAGLRSGTYEQWQQRQQDPTLQKNIARVEELDEQKRLREQTSTDRARESIDQGASPADAIEGEFGPGSIDRTAGSGGPTTSTRDQAERRQTKFNKKQAQKAILTEKARKRRGKPPLPGNEAARAAVDSGAIPSFVQGKSVSGSPSAPGQPGQEPPDFSGQHFVRQPLLTDTSGKPLLDVSGNPLALPADRRGAGMQPAGPNAPAQNDQVERLPIITGPNAPPQNDQIERYPIITGPNAPPQNDQAVLYGQEGQPHPGLGTAPPGQPAQAPPPPAAPGQPPAQPKPQESTRVTIGGNEMDIPLSVPSLTAAEKEHLASGGQPTHEIIRKSKEFARNRVMRGQDPFFDQKKPGDPKTGDTFNFTSPLPSGDTSAPIRVLPGGIKLPIGQLTGEDFAEAYKQMNPNKSISAAMEDIAKERTPAGRMAEQIARRRSRVRNSPMTPDQRARTEEILDRREKEVLQQYSEESAREVATKQAAISAGEKEDFEAIVEAEIETEERESSIIEEALDATAERIKTMEDVSPGERNRILREEEKRIRAEYEFKAGGEAPDLTGRPAGRSDFNIIEHAPQEGVSDELMTDGVHFRDNGTLGFQTDDMVVDLPAAIIETGPEGNKQKSIIPIITEENEDQIKFLPDGQAYIYNNKLVPGKGKAGRPEIADTPKDRIEAERKLVDAAYQEIFEEKEAEQTNIIRDEVAQLVILEGSKASYVASGDDEGAEIERERIKVLTAKIEELKKEHPVVVENKEIRARLERGEEEEKRLGAFTEGGLYRRGDPDAVGRFIASELSGSRLIRNPDGSKSWAFSAPQTGEETTTIPSKDVGGVDTPNPSSADEAIALDFRRTGRIKPLMIPVAGDTDDPKEIVDRNKEFQKSIDGLGRQFVQFGPRAPAPEGEPEPPIDLSDRDLGLFKDPEREEERERFYSEVNRIIIQRYPFMEGDSDEKREMRVKYAEALIDRVYFAGTSPTIPTQ